MKTLDNTNLGYLLTKIKNAFIRTTDVESVSEVTIDSTPTTNSDNLVTSGGVYEEIKDVAHIDPESSALNPLELETISNKVQTLAGNESDTDKYPSCKAVSAGLGMKENVVGIEAPVDQSDATAPITALSCEVGKYYRIDVAIGTLAITFPAPDDVTRISSIVISFTTDSAPAVTFTTSAVGGVVPPIYAQDGFVINASTTYEVNVIFNGAAWIVAAMEIGSTALI